jgi:ADP-ribosyl-[dinitrogen reductase] hydrolase
VNDIDPDAVVGCLLGQAVGDMMGLPMENLSPRRIAKLFPTLDRPRFFFGYGMGSDDTEHACMTAQVILRSGGDVDRFRRSLAWRLRWWFAACPPGVGLATAKACIKLWLGFPSTKSGVFSAGNGPAMRAAVIGVVCANAPGSHLQELVAASTRLTHTDPKADYGALVIALAAKVACQSRSGPPIPPEQFLAECRLAFRDDAAAKEMLTLVEQVVGSVNAGISLEEFWRHFNQQRGVSGYILHTVPVALFTFFRHPDDYRTAIESVIRLGGDTDTVAAITGALVGTRVGKAGIPADWLDRFADWPWSLERIERCFHNGAQYCNGVSIPPTPQKDFWLLALPILRPLRNLVFFLIVLCHIARRLLPPY